MLKLTALNGQDKGREFQLTGQQPELLGRQAPTIKLTDAQTSRRHAEILLENNTWLIRDLGSTNGTWVNGQRITQITELEVGDRVVLGRHQFRVSQITDIPAPSPKPKPVQPEPAIGHEELGEMGIDLSESLSADLLDDEGSGVPVIPTEALESDDEPVEPAPAIEEPPAAKAPAADADDDGLIDLDALLAEPADEAAPDTDADEPADEPVAEAPAETEPPAAPAADDDGVIDLDAMLADEPAEEPPSEPVEAADEEPVDEPINLDHAPVEEVAEAEPVAEIEPESPPADDEPITLDDEVSEAVAPVQSDAEDDDVFDLDDMLGEAEPETEDTDSAAPTEASTPDEPADEEPEPAAAASDDEPFDVDAYLGLESDDEPAVQAPTVEDTPDDDEPVLTPAASDDAIEDLDDVLTDLPDSPETLEAIDEEPEPEQPEETPEEPEEPESDSLVDIDILADAKPADFSSDDSGVIDPLADSAILDADDESPKAAAATPIDDETAPPGEDFMMSPEDQAQAVSGYKRSRLMRKLVVAVLFLAVLGVAGGFIYNYYLDNDANARSTPTATPSNTPTTPEPDIEPVTEPTPQTDTAPAVERDSLANNTAPDQKQPTPEPEQPEQLDTTATEQNTGLSRPTPDQMAPPLPEDAGTNATPDPFADVNTTLAETTPAEPQTEPRTPDQPEAATDPVPTEPIALLDPKLDTTPAATTDEPATDTQTPTPTTNDSTAAVAPVTTTDTPTDSTAAPEAVPSEHTAIDVLTEAIESQHETGDDVAELAAFADARRITYVVDASGSLVDNFPQVLQELNLEVASLPNDAAFTVVFFGSDDVIEVPPAGLRWADGKNKREVREWTHPTQGNVTAWGRGDPIQAIKHATKYNPTEVVILSDNLIGRQSTREDIAQLLVNIENVLNEDVLRVNVIQFFNRDPQQVLKSIAEHFNGTYSLILARPSAAAQSAVDDPLTGN